jgi:hypothetical protein
MDKYNKETAGPLAEACADDAQEHRKKSDLLMRKELDRRKTLFATYGQIGIVVATYWYFKHF